jgi:dTDP-glucose pyrophosphorylase
VNVIILMAGHSDKFSESGYKYPKCLVEVQQRPIVEHVVDNIKPLLIEDNKVIFIIRKSDSDKYYLENILQLLVPDSCVVKVTGNNSGAAISTLLAIEEINKSEPIVIINGDQIIDKNHLELVNNFKDSDGGTVVFKSVHPRWSYVKCDEKGFVIEAAEKKPISNLATAGFYYFHSADDYFKFTKSMILKDAHINNMFYVCPVFNEMILAKKKITVTEIDSNKYHSLMDPDMVTIYEKFLELKKN